MMEASPKAPFERIEPQVILGALVVLFDVPAGAAQFQAKSFGRRLVQVSQIVVIRFGIARRPVDHQPDLFQFAPGVAQFMLQEDRRPSQTRAPGFPSHCYTRGVLPFRRGDATRQLAKVWDGGSSGCTWRRTHLTSVRTS